MYTRRARLGLVRQSDATTPGDPAQALVVPFTGTPTVNPNQAILVDDAIRGTLSKRYRTFEGVKQPEVNFESYAMPDIVGALLFGILGSDAVTGTGPYQHVIVPAWDPPYWTVYRYSDVSNGDLRIVGLRIASVEISWNTAEGLVTVSTNGQGLDFEQGDWPLQDPSADTIIRGWQVSVQIDGNDYSAVNGTIRFTRDMERVYLGRGNTRADMMVEDAITVEVDLSALYDTAQALANAMDQSTTHALAIRMVDQATNEEIRVEIPKYQMAREPVGFDLGSLVEKINVNGTAVHNDAGAFVTATVVNNIASY